MSPMIIVIIVHYDAERLINIVGDIMNENSPL